MCMMAMQFVLVQPVDAHSIMVIQYINNVKMPPVHASLNKREEYSCHKFFAFAKA